MPRRELPRGRHWPKALLAAALICGTSSSRADQAPLQLDYAADSGCPDRRAFADLVEQRVAAAGDQGIAVTPSLTEVRLLADGSGFVGQLALVRSDGSRYQREVHGASCAEVANALAFVLALTLTAQEQPRAVVPEPPQVAVPPVLVVPPRVPEKPVQKPRSPWDYGVGLQLGARAGLAPEWALAGGAFLEARRASAGPFGFSLRAALVGASVAHVDQLGVTDFSWWAARLEACPLRFRLLERLELVPCAGSHVGRLTATAYPTVESASSVGSSSHTWVDGFAALRLESSLVRWLSLQAQLEMLVPFTRFRFAFDNPDTLVYQVPAVASAAFVGVELRFP